MDRLVLEIQEQGRLISVEDSVLVSDLELRWSEQRAQLKRLGRKPNCIYEELTIKYARLELLRRAAHRFKQLAEADHRHLYGEVAPRVSARESETISLANDIDTLGGNTQ